MTNQKHQKDIVMIRSEQSWTEYLTKPVYKNNVMA